MRRDELYLKDIIEAVDHIGTFIASADSGHLAAARVSEGLRANHLEVPWPQIAAFRNILVHAYFGIDCDEVWRAARNRCPVLREQISAILAGEFGTSEKADS